MTKVKISEIKIEIPEDLEFQKSKQFVRNNALTRKKFLSNLYEHITKGNN